MVAGQGLIWFIPPVMKTFFCKFLLATCFVGLVSALVTPVEAARTSHPPVVIIVDTKPVISRY
jgi:hypothetical protein